MGRPSKLTEPMREEILKRMATGDPGDSIRQIARDFKIGEATLRRNFSAQAPQVKRLAMTQASVEIETARLPISAQRAVMSLAEQFKRIQGNVAMAAALNSRTATILSQKAADVADDLGDDFSDDGEDRGKVRTINALMSTSNEALKPALALFAANKGKDDIQGKSLEDLLEEANRMGRPA